MPTTLFEGLPPTCDAPLRPGQSYFQWLARSTMYVTAQSREVFDRWFGLLQDGSTKHDIFKRFRAKNNAVHDAAAFELLMLGVFDALKFNPVSGIELNATESRPFGSVTDLVVHTPGGDRMVEITSLHPSIKSVRREQMLHALFDNARRHVRRTSFTVWLHGYSASKETPSSRALAKFLDDYVSRFSHDDLVELSAAGKLKWVHRQANWILRGSIVPMKEPDYRPKDLLGAHSSGAHWDQSSTKALEAVKGKMSQHPSWKGATWIAIASMHPIDRLDEEDLLQR